MEHRRHPTHLHAQPAVPGEQHNRWTLTGEDLDRNLLAGMGGAFLTAGSDGGDRPFFQAPD